MNPVVGVRISVKLGLLFIQTKLSLEYQLGISDI